MRKNYNFLILIAVFCLICLGSQFLGTQVEKEGEFNSEKKFTAKQLKDDFELLRNALEEGHGGLYRYTSKEELDRQFESIFKNLDQPLTEIEFLRLLFPLIANINDGHTGINPSTALRSYLENEPILLPFKIKFIDEKAYLHRNYSQDEDLALGGEVISINGRPISEVLERMLAVLSSDGHIQTSKYRRLESTVFLWELYNLLFGKTTSYSITYKSQDNNELKKIEVKGLRRKELTNIFTERYPDAAKIPPPIELDYREDIAILTIRTFGGGSYQRAKISYPGFMKKSFREFEEKDIKALIIDLRNNGGGADLFGKILFAYLTDKPFKYYKHLRVKKKEFLFLEHTDVPPKERKLPDNRLKENDSGTYDLLGHPNQGIQNPIKPTFKGKVYVLINGASFSTSGECTSLIHFHKKAKFVGEECGAGYYGNTSGFMPKLTLPNTGIQVRIPLVKYSMAVSGYAPDRGINPDYPVVPRIEDVLNEKDTEMDFVIELIEKSR
ncbi:MAG: hypothetical protein GTO16_13260 [Candidatus Aminicenantes bacterium]|nr:hypothetical protein [Candidatus Aminicenantes bacterium]